MIVRSLAATMLIAAAAAAEQVPATIRYASWAFADRMIGGRFQGSDRSDGGWVDLYRIGPATPHDWDNNLVPPGNDLPLPGIPGRFRYLRYLGPPRSSCNIAELRFLAGDGQAIDGMRIGSTGSFAGRGDTLAKAFDGDPRTRFDAPQESGCWVGLDLGGLAALPTVELAAPDRPVSLAGVQPPQVRATAYPRPGAGRRIAEVSFWLVGPPAAVGGAASWTRAGAATAAPWTAILRFAAAGEYTVVAQAIDDARSSVMSGGARVTVAVSGLSEVRCYADPWSNIAGCVVEGGDGGPEGDYTTLLTLPAQAPAADAQGYFRFAVAPGQPWRWLRFRRVAPASGQIADLRFYAGDTLLGGTPFGDGSTAANAFDWAAIGDGTRGTYVTDASYVGIDRGPQSP